MGHTSTEPSWGTSILVLLLALIPLQRGWARQGAKRRKEISKSRRVPTHRRAGKAARPTGEERRKALAKKTFAKGQRYFLKRRYKRAVSTFHRAFSYWPYRVIHYNLALAYRFMRRYKKAYEHLHIYLQGAKKKERRLPRVLRKLKSRFGYVSVKVNHKNAVVEVNGKRVGKGEVGLVVRPGEKRIAILIDDRQVARKIMDVDGGEEKTWDVVLGANPTPILPTTKKGLDGRRGVHWVYFTVAAALTVAGAVTAGVLSARTKVHYDAFWDDRANADLRDRGVAMKRASEISWGITGAFAVGTAVLAVFTEWRQRSQRSSGSGEDKVDSRGASPGARRPEETAPNAFSVPNPTTAVPGRRTSVATRWGVGVAPLRKGALVTLSWSR